MKARLAILFVVLITALVAFQPQTASAGHGSNALWVGERLYPNQYLATGPHLAKMGNNGDFVLYKNGVGCWSTGTAGRGDYRSFITMQGDGNLVIYAYDGGPALWASGTTVFAGGHLEIQSGTIAASLAITDSRTYNFWIATCN